MSPGTRSARATISLLVICALLTASAAPALAAAKCPRTTEVALENKVMCQVCGVPLALANSLEADRERAFITTLVNRCESTAQIERALVGQYGPGILATPGTHGFAITAWLIPVLVMLVAAASIAAALVGSRRRNQTAEPASSTDLSPSEDARVDAALAAFNQRHPCDVSSRHADARPQQLPNLNEH